MFTALVSGEISWEICLVGLTGQGQWLMKATMSNVLFNFRTSHTFPRSIGLLTLFPFYVHCLSQQRTQLGLNMFDIFTGQVQLLINLRLSQMCLSTFETPIPRIIEILAPVLLFYKTNKVARWIQSIDYLKCFHLCLRGVLRIQVKLATVKKRAFFAGVYPNRPF